MSGIEIAGLVLGAFPIAIEGIKAYSSGMKTISDIRNYKQILRQFARELSVEKCKFENTCLGLLSELVNSAKLELMMANPGGKEWNDEFFRLQLKNRLGPANEASENWLEIVAELNQMLRMVGERFQIPQDNGKKPSWMKPLVPAKFDPRLAWEVGMLTSYRNDHITQIRQWNRDLSELANGGKKSLAGLNLDQPKIDISLLDYHKRIQKHAKFIYYALKEKIESPMCKCGIPHSVHLQLQMRGTPPTKALSKAGAHISSPNKSLTFNFIFSTEASATERTTIQWKEFQLEHIEERRGVKSIGVKRQPATEIILSSPSSSSSSVASLPERGRPKSRGKADQPKSPLMDKPPLTEFLGASSPTTTRKHSSSRLSSSFKHVKGIFSRIASRDQSSSPAPLPTVCQPSPTTKDKFSQITSQNRSSSPIIPHTVCQPYPTPTKKARFLGFSDDCESDESDGNSIHIDQSLTIYCLCTSLSTYTYTNHTTITPPNCVGLLISADNRKHRVWPAKEISPRPSSLVSLADLITTLNKIETPSRRDRLVLGLKLISSILQLNSTNWLTEIWGAGDIFFPKTDLRTPGQHKKALCRPFIHRKFSLCSTIAGDDHPDPQQQPVSHAIGVIGCNQSLYSLGIILLEIWHWQTFSSMRSSLSTGLSELLAAYYLSDQLFDEAGHQYSMAVRRCIRGLDMPGVDLEDDSFRKRVYQDVLGPLEADLKMFCQCDDLKDVIGAE